MNSEFKRKWIYRINTSSDSKCRLFLLRLKEQDINIPFTKKQKFVYALCKDRLEYLAQKNNTNKNITKLPRAEMSDLNWKTLKQEKELDEEIGRRNFRFSLKAHK